MTYRVSYVKSKIFAVFEALQLQAGKLAAKINHRAKIMNLPSARV